MKRTWNNVLLLIFLVFMIIPGMLYASDEKYEGWKRIETAHFELIFEPRDLESALHVASFADEVYDELTALLNYAPIEHIPVVISGRTSWANGCYSSFPATVFLFVTSPEDRFLGARSSDWLRSLFVHEVSHYIHLTSPVGVAKYLKKIFGPGVLSMYSPFMDGWWVEGLTTYTETNFAEGGRGDSSLFALTYQAPLQEGAMWSIRQGAYQSSFPPSGRIYTTGYLMVDYIMRTYGTDIFSKVNTRFAWFPFFGISPALKQETGYTAKQLFTFALAEKQKGIGNRSISFFSPAEGNYYLPYVTEKGLLGFSYTNENGGALVSYQGTDCKLLTKLPISDQDSLGIASDGRSAVFSMYWTDSSNKASLSLASVGYSDLYRYDLTSDSFTRLTYGKLLYAPALNCTGTRLIASQRVDSRYRLVEVDQKTGQLTVLYENPQGSIYEPKISSDGKSIIAIEIVEGNSCLVEIEKDGTKVLLVGPSKGEIRNPRFIDGDTIWFSSDETGIYCLYEVSRKTLQVHELFSDQIGVLGALKMKDSFIYQSYTAKGFVLGSTPVSACSFSPVSLNGTLPKLQSIGKDVKPDVSVQPYLDFPRFNLFLPMPFDDGNSLTLGAWIHFSSLLRKHQFIIYGGYSFAKDLPLLELSYAYTPGPYELTLEAFVNKKYTNTEKRQQALTLDFTLPVWKETRVKTYQQLALDTYFSGILRDDTSRLGSALQLAYQINGRSNPKDYFGTTSLFSYAGIMTQFDTQTETWFFKPFGGVESKLKVFRTSQTIGLDVAVLASNTGILATDLPFDGTIYGKGEGEAKALVSVRYTIPLGLFDQPIPYGGLTKMGLSLVAQSAFYYSTGHVDWEQDIYVGGKLSVNLIVGSSAILKPFVGLSISSFTGVATWYFGVDSNLQIGSSSLPAW
ncbi:hypothetical protein [uncultured Sphaerochaeta sp.]|uniref:TolB family protein n=1 Tax=uncultured Sphaerochaeta sp. TaxID=886478 RepID=UPI002A0A33FD|nr:hypothetical protein [uncultured Sphaerochaeta sp.]